VNFANSSGKQPNVYFNKGQVMKIFFNYSIFLVAVLGFSSAVIAYQGGGGEATRSEKGDPKSRPKTKTNPNIAKSPNSPNSKAGPINKASMLAELTITSRPGNCQVILDGKEIGPTNQDGLLNLKDLKPGHHILIVRKEKYQEANSTLDLIAGQSQVFQANLAPLPGRLSVISTVAGASIEISGMGNYSDSVSDLRVKPGTYHIRLVKNGYQPLTREVEIKAAEPISLELTLQPLTANELLGQANEFFSKKEFDKVINTCQTLLNSQPNNPQANYLIGNSYYISGRYGDSISYLAKAINSGLTVNIPLKHIHKLILGENLCTGQLSFEKGAISFRSIVGGHDFTVPINKLLELSYEPQKAERLHVVIAIPKGNKEDRKTYNFHPIEATTEPVRANSDIYTVRCSGCPHNMSALLDLIKLLQSGN
jgi:hypothetical protein